jgi:cytidylate kinase
LSAVVLVAIDGPSGAGKSTAAKGLAARLAIPYIDTGAMYRAVGLAAREAGIPLPLVGQEVADRVAGIAQGLRIELVPDSGGARVHLDDRDVTDSIREPEISLYASAVSAIPAVRRRLVAEQQRMGRTRGGVLEGRDIGTKVFPETPFKFFLTAAPAIRADRRTRELAGRGTPQPYEDVLAEMVKRDRDDATRADSPLTLDSGYFVIDTGTATPDEVISTMEQRVAAGRGGGETGRIGSGGGQAG